MEEYKKDTITYKKYEIIEKERKKIGKKLV